MIGQAGGRKFKIWIKRNHKSLSQTLICSNGISLQLNVVNLRFFKLWILSWQLLYWKPLILIAKSRYPPPTLMIFSLILSFWYVFGPIRVLSFIMHKNLEVSWLLIGCSVSTINTLIFCSLDNFPVVNVRLNKSED